MNIRDYFKALVPKTIKNTPWESVLEGGIVDFYEQYFKPEKIDLLENNFDIETKNQDQLATFLQSFGFQVLQLEGYTASIDYLRKEARVAGYKVLKNSTKRVYPYILYPFNLSGAVFPLIINSDYSLQEFLNPAEDPTGTIQGQSISLDTGRYLDEGSIAVLYYTTPLMDTGLTMDSGLLFDQKIPIYDGAIGTAWFLDGDIIEGRITRHFLLSYYFMTAESSIDFISYNTAFVLYNKLYESKSEVSIPHFQPFLMLQALSSNVGKSVEYPDVINGDNGSIDSILITSDLSAAYTIQFGDSKQPTIDTSITGVANLIHEEVIGDSVERETNLTFTSAATLSGKYFIIPVYTGIDYVFWYNVDGGSTMPSVPGKHLIEVAILSSDTSDIVTTKTSSVISSNLNAYFYITPVSAATINIKMKYPIYEDSIYDVDSGTIITETVPFSYGFLVEQSTSVILDIQQKIYAYTTFPDISEIALKDELGNCIWYSRFPKINFYEAMLRSLRVQFLVS